MNKDLVIVAPLKLEGSLQTFSIEPQAENLKLALVTAAKECKEILDPYSFAIAQGHKKSLQKFRTSVEKNRKEIKDPIRSLGEQIDSLTANFLVDAIKEEQRIDAMISEYAEAVAEEQRQREIAAEKERQRLEQELLAAEKKQADEKAAIEKAKTDAELAKKQAEIDRLNAQLAKDKEAEEEAKRQAEEAKAKEDAAKALLETHEQQVNLEKATHAREMVKTIPPPVLVPKGAREVIDFEVLDIALFYSYYPHMCEVNIFRGKLLKRLGELNEEFNGKIPPIPGIKVTKSYKVGR